MIRVTPDSSLENRAELEKEVDADLEAFSKDFQQFGTDPLSRPERAIIKTYLAYKLGLMK